jgi:hypothetical protein
MMRRTVVRWAAPGLGLLALMVGGPLSVAAQGAEGFHGTFGALASADAVRVTWLVPHAPVSDTVFDAGGPSAQATLDSLGGSQAWAAYPYPGENVVTGPAVIAGASGGQINLPAYPFWVGSDYPTTPKAESGNGAYGIKAESTDTSSVGSATVGLASDARGAVGLARSVASTIAEPDHVTAEATTEVTAFAVGPLRIASVVSKAKTVYSATGEITRDADTQITGAKVGDTPVMLTAQGLVVGSSAVPANIKPIADALAQAKIGLEFMPRQDSDTGVVAPAVKVTQRDDSGGSITYVLGRTSAFAQGEGTEAPAAAVPADESSTSSAAQPEAAAPAVAPEPAAPPGDPAPLARAAEASPVTTAGQDAPVSCVLPEPAGTAVDRPTAMAPPTPTVVQLASERNGTVANSGRGRRRAALGLLINAGDTRPMFLVLTLGLAAGLGIALVLGRLGKAQ